MRIEKEMLLKDQLRLLAIRTRDRLDLTQREMAERLEMSESSYSDIETGVYMCGTLTAMLLLLMQEDPRRFLQALDEAFAKQYEGLLLT
ncbi:MAG: helix-turn-helix domain-containing protein [Clostridia bacterium]|nr:helix-turn-helix domain-containing protein [Clostridia bacterium]